MRLPNWLSRSIGLTQAVAVLLASLVISLLLSAVQLAHTFSNQQQHATELGEEILTLAEGGATTASWTLDERLAKEVIQSVIALGEVHTATLVDESDTVMAAAEREDKDYGTLTQLFAMTFIGDPIHSQRHLSVTAGGREQKVGTLSIALAPEHIAERFIVAAIPVMIAGLLQALAIGLVLLWLSSRLVTTPLQRAALAIAEIDPENPAATAVAIPPAHKHNELGYLLEHTNRMVARLSSVQQQLRTLATHDPLTELPNRSFVVTRLERAVARAKRNGTQVAVLFLDLDDFKTINDSHGHSLGDELLVQVTERLRSALRANDTVGRLGGDEFLIVIEDILKAAEVVPTAQRIEKKLATPFVLGNSEVLVNCSIGVAVFPEDGADATDLMRHSDMAMYQAKEQPGSQFHFFTQEMSERMHARVNMESALRQALEFDEFELAYQPKIDTHSGALAGCEILLRWQYNGRLIAAGEFIEVAEQTGIVVDIGYQVLQRGCQQAREWAIHHEPIPFAINVSAQQLREPDFVDRVCDTAKRYEVQPGMLELEITETVLIEELTHAVDKLEKLRSAGFVISIDDFGTGYSSLSYLTHLPANALKIDRSFVSGPQSSEIVLDMIIAMAQALQLTTVAEGVETEEQRDKLIAKGCDVLQGYLLGKPMCASEFEDTFLRAVA
ncbi:MAG: putative bifunctional diguanylate cyclase/phosphodiesterase [Pseudomonadales bacterium]